MSFRIELEQPAMAFSGGFVADAWAKIKELSEAIVAKAEELLKQNLPEWDVVEAELKKAYDTYVRPIDIPSVPFFIEGKVDDFLCAALVAAVKKIYDDLASGGTVVYADPA